MADKIMWLEGMALSPQHFQAWEAWAEGALDARWRLAMPFAYGFSALELDRQALADGFFALREAEGLFPDGLHFRFPDRDPAPESRPFAEAFRPGAAAFPVYLAVPAWEPAGANLAAPGEARPTRYTEVTREVPDANTGAEPRPVAFGRPRLRILFEGEPQAGYQVLKVAELARDPAGRVAPSEDYVPPCLRAGASPVLLAGLRRLAERCMGRAAELSSRRTAGAGGQSHFPPEALTACMVSAAVGRALPGLLHALRHPHAHPEAVYRELSAFAGALEPFSDPAAAGEPPAYAHGDLRTTFRQLFRLLESRLLSVLPSGCRVIPFARVSPMRYLADLRGAEALAGPFYLGVYAQAPEAEILATMLRKAKAGPLERMDAIVNAALPGLTLVPDAAPPKNLPAKPGYKYFRLRPEGELWKQALASSALGLHFPADFPEVKLEFLALE